jgi:hypothetical protein
MSKAAIKKDIALYKELELKKLSGSRPMPPKELGAFETYPRNIIPAHDMPLWVKNTFLEPASKLFNNDHYHLYDAMQDGGVVFLWAAGGFTKQMRHVIGQTEQVMFRVSGFQRMRLEQQLHEWFGSELPEFIITLDGSYCAQCTDVEFCALIEHELYHVGIALDEWGVPKFNNKTGRPALTMRGHDVEEFVGIVERYGTGYKDGALSRLVEAANAKPLVAKVDVAHACGTCLKLVA